LVFRRSFVGFVSFVVESGERRRILPYWKPGSLGRRRSQQQTEAPVESVV